MAGRGGRGGGRGGGAAGRGGGLFSTGSSLMGGISYNDVMEGSKLAAEAKLYPQAPLPDFQEPTNREQRSQVYMKQYLRKLRFSAYHVAVPEPKDDAHTKYSDRYEDPVEELPTLLTETQKARLNPDFFPQATWDMYFNKKLRTTKRTKIKKKADEVVGGDEQGEDQEEKDGEERRSGDEEEEEQDAFDDEEENADYDNNYFDNGEDDGDGDEGGGGDEATYD
ncbi:hypothetical protein P389DRAFT_207332 [Cystobasidium minutum MCA 4210]|uniref:uncharacterized protein n=1 Tax=Cystobasidium minutum MCA 4210 TaxID=1397322 RepID=UPI0034CEFA14|eukprot:jgi/Rhomi1/207332/estExt_Genemark1.C_1_t10222